MSFLLISPIFRLLFCVNLLSFPSDIRKSSILFGIVFGLMVLMNAMSCNPSAFMSMAVAVLSIVLLIFSDSILSFCGFPCLMNCVFVVWGGFIP